MDVAAYEQWQAISIPEYAQEKIEAGTWPESEALERSAQAALAEVEAWAREHGCAGVQLHVHGANTGACQVYLRAGFVETDVTMLKRVASDS